MNFRYIISVLSAFDKVRRDSVLVEEPYLQRMRDWSPFFSTNSTSLSRTKSKTFFVGRLISWGRSGVEAVAGFAQRIKLIPEIFYQIRRMNKHKKLIEHNSILIIGIASNRILLNERSESPKKKLSELLNTLGKCANHDLAKKIPNAKGIFLFDPLPLSRLWKYNEKYWCENVFIVDGTFLLFVFFDVFLKRVIKQSIMILKLTWKCYSILKSQRDLSLRRFKKFFFSILITNTFSDILRGYLKQEALFLTSNSMLTELLRAYLIQAQNCEQIFEIMHGVGSIQVERFFFEVLEAGREFGAYEKHYFIPQVPNLPLYGVFKRQSKYSPDFAINTYLNRYFIENQNCNKRNNDFIETEYNAICAGEKLENPVVMTIYGYNPSDGLLFDSPSYQLECEIIARICQFKKLLESGLLLIYVPHPVHSSAVFDNPAFKKNDVKIYHNSIFTWLISDLCVSLISSCMFEAVYFGVRSFTPLLPSDNIFTESYLNLVTYPRSDSFEDCVNELHQFMVNYVSSPSVDIVERAKRRLELA